MLGKRRGEDDDIDFFVLNPHPELKASPLPFVLTSADLRFVPRAVVVVKAGIQHIQFGRPRPLSGDFPVRGLRFSKHALRAFDADTRSRCSSSRPSSFVCGEGRASAAPFKGIDAVIPFRTMLMDLVAKTEINRNYQKSDLLQLIRILKISELLKESDLRVIQEVAAADSNGAEHASFSAFPNRPKWVTVTFDYGPGHR
jgi:hypothetical protein